MASGDDVAGARARCRSTPPAFAPTGGSCRRRAATPPGIASPKSIARHDPHCRGVLLLGLEASEDELARSFARAAPHPICRGFAVGRSIFAPAAAAWFAGSASDDEVVADIAARYARLVDLWRRARDAAAPATRRATSSIALKDTA